MELEQHETPLVGRDDTHFTAGKTSITQAEVKDRDTRQDDDVPHISTGAAASDEIGHVYGVKLLAIMTGITFACFLVLLDTAILVTAIPSITTDFQSLTNIGWYGAAYQLGSAALVLLTGKCYSNFHVKSTFFVFFGVFELGSLLCGVAVSSDMLIVGRAVAGLGASGILNGTFTIIAACVPMHRRPSLLGISLAVAQFGLVIGPLIGGALTQYTTWRWCFYLNLPCGGLVAALLLFTKIPDQNPHNSSWAHLKRIIYHEMDLLGTILFAPSCIMLLLAVQWGGNTYAWRSATIIGLFVGSGVNFLVWLVWDWHKKEAAMVPLSMVKTMVVWSGCLNYGLLMSTTFCTSYYLPIYFQSVRGAGPTLSGVYMLPSVIAQAIGSYQLLGHSRSPIVYEELARAVGAGRLVQRFGYYLPFALFSSVCMSVGYGLLSTFTPSTGTGKWVGYQILFGFGRGIGMQMPLVAVQNNTPPPRIAVAMGLTVFAQTFGGSLFLSFSDTIFTNSLQSALAGSLPSNTVSKILESGGLGFRQLLLPSQLALVLSAYANAIDRIFYMLVASAILCFFSAWGLGWKDVRKKA